MSRHKLVKTLDFDDELEDYSGGATYDQGESVGEGLSHWVIEALIALRSTVLTSGSM